MPVAERRWFVDRLVAEFEKANENAQKNDATPLSRAAHMNDSMSRELSGLTRTNPPARGRRFT